MFPFGAEGDEGEGLVVRGEVREKDLAPLGEAVDRHGARGGFHFRFFFSGFGFFWERSSSRMAAISSLRGVDSDSLARCARLRSAGGVDAVELEVGSIEVCDRIDAIAFGVGGGVALVEEGLLFLRDADAFGQEREAQL